MSVTTITAEATAADLLAELRDLVNRYDGAETLDDARELLDAVTAKLRRARGRINRIVKATAPPAPVVEPKPAAEPAAKFAGVTDDTGKRAEPKAERPAAPLPPAAAKLRETAPAAATPRPRPAPRRQVTSFHVALAVLTVVATVWSTTTTRTSRAVSRTARAVRSASRRAGRFGTAVRTVLARLGGAS